MSARLALPPYAAQAGLGGVRALAGLGCGCQAANPPAASGLGAVMDVVKAPLFLGVVATLAVVGFTLWRER